MLDTIRERERERQRVRESMLDTLLGVQFIRKDA